MKMHQRNAPVAIRRSPPSNRSQATLNVDQVRRLYAVMREQFEVHGRGNFPTLSICLRRLIRTVMTRMDERGLTVKRAKMNGGAASYVLATKNLPYNDIDLIFDVDLSPKPGSSMSTTTAKFEAIKNAVFDALIEFLPPDANKAKISAASMKDAYVRKMVKVCEHNANGASGDLWSLISLNNDYGRYVELKFVDRMRRQFEFSVDSFQLDLGPIVRRDSLTTSSSSKTKTTNYRTCIQSDQSEAPGPVPTPLTAAGATNHESFEYDEDESVKITAESVYGNFRLALKHLNEMLIDTVQPELIRGGGLLKYVNLLVRGYRPARPARDVYRMERYMCSRFFIDFGACDQQQRKLRNYLDNHFHADLRTKYEYLLILHKVVDESTVCLMNHELEMSLSAIEQLSMEVRMELCYQQQLQAATEAVSSMSMSHVTGANGGGGSASSWCRCRRASAGSSTVVSSSLSSLSSSTSSSVTNRNGLLSPQIVANTDQQQGAPGQCHCCQGQCQSGQGQHHQQQHQQCVLHSPDAQTAAGAQHPPQFQLKQTLLFVPHNASYWIPVV